MKLDFYFDGYARGVEINRVLDLTGQEIDISNLKPEQLAIMLNNKECSIGLIPALQSTHDVFVDIKDFVKSRYYKMEKNMGDDLVDEIIEIQNQHLKIKSMKCDVECAKEYLEHMKIELLLKAKRIKNEREKLNKT